MSLTTEQLQILKADIATHPVWGSMAQTGDNAYAIAAGYNQPANPDYWVYKTSLTEKALYEETSPDATTWNWQTYMAQTATERETWGRLMSAGAGGMGGGGGINPSLAQTRTGINQIFSGSTAPVIAQRTHLAAMFRRRATDAEALFVTSGAGTTASPGVMGFEGRLTPSDVEQAWALP